MPPPQLSFKGQQLRPVSLIGVGATSSVYRCTRTVDGQEEEFAVKVLQGSLSADRELEVLGALGDGGCDCIPVCHGRLDLPSQGFLMRPLGTTLAADGVLLQHPHLYRALPPMVRALSKAHELGYVHRDLRLPNLLVVKASAASSGSQPGAPPEAASSSSSNSSLFLLDWWVVNGRRGTG